MKLNLYKLLLYTGLLLLPSVAAAQATKDDFVKGKIYLVSGDTLDVLIKPDREERVSKQISVWDEQNLAPRRYLPKDLNGFVLENEEYTAKKDFEGKKVFMKIVEKGPVTLYGHTYREDKGKKEIVTDYYLEKKGSGFKQVPEAKGKFRTDMSYYFADDFEIAQKIDDKVYQFGDIETVVSDYNERRKPSQPIANNNNNNNNTPRDTAGTRPVIRDNNPQLIDDTDKPILRSNVPERPRKTIGVEAMAMATYTLISYPNTLSQVYRTTSGGAGFEFGVGFRATVARGLTFRTGINIRDKAFKFTANTLQLVDGQGNVTTATINETGRTYYPGIYFNIGQEWKYFMVGGGFTSSFYSGYRGKYNFTTSSGFSGSEDKTKGSLMVHDINKPDGSENNFNMQFDINLTIGGRFAVGDKLTLKPVLMYSIPMVPLFNSGVTVNNGLSNVELNVHAYSLKLGLIVDFGNW
ncbi:MAG: hypothetical protein ACT6QS_04340 [Flavobacteriales bacterium]